MQFRRWSALLLATLLITGCGTVPRAPAPTPPASVEAPTSPPAEQGAHGQATSPVQPSPTSALSATSSAPPSSLPVQASTTADLVGCLAEAPRPPADARRVTVRRAIDGDTLELEDGTRVRMIGVNTPESVDPRRPVEYLGKEASAYTQQILGGQEVLLLPGRTPQDRYGRTLAWLWFADGRMINALLVYDGYAQVSTYADNPDHAELLRRCQQEARVAGRGLWAPTEASGETATAPATGGPGSTSAAAGVTITQHPGPVARGSVATVAATTTPGASCSITVEYRSGPSKAKGLEPITADSAGTVSWTWEIGIRTATGTWPVTVTCGGQSAATAVTVL